MSPLFDRRITCEGCGEHAHESTADGWQLSPNPDKPVLCEECNTIRPVGRESSTAGGSPMSVESQTDTETETDIDLDGNSARITTVETRTQTVDDLFENGELILWSDGFGWSGFEREDGEFYDCNFMRDGENSQYLTRERISEERVIEKIERHIEDEHAGGVGRFATRCTPP